MELETKEKALEDLRVVAEGDFKGVERIFIIQGECDKATGDISNVGYSENCLDNEVARINAERLINLLIDETELTKVRDDIEDGSISYEFKLECASRMLVLELMIVWKDKR